MEIDLDLALLILTFVSTSLWGVYVYYTYKTFKEIKKQAQIQHKSLLQIEKQTELQHRALLSVIPKESRIDAEHYPWKARELHNKWKGIITRNMPDLERDDFKEKALILILANRGKSDIVFWSIEIIAEITGSTYMRRSNINEDKFVSDDETPHLKWEIKSSSSEQIIPGEKIEIPILLYGYFPEVMVTWNITYTDIRNQSYTYEHANTHELRESKLINYS